MRYFCFVNKETRKIELNISAINEESVKCYASDKLIGPIEVDEIYEPTEYYYFNGTFQKYKEPCPSPDHVYDIKTQTWKNTNKELIKYNNELIRNDKLTRTDWTQVIDADISEESRKEFQEYRQKLRDIDKLNPVWPDEPEIKKRGQ